jgi:hypothetical protein
MRSSWLGTRYADFGPTLATEVLLERHDLRVGRETLRRWMMADGLWLSRAQRRTFHQPRLRRESYGELIQIDGSDHRWFEQRGDPCTLLVFIDDTSKLMQLRFVPSESTDSYFEALHGYLRNHGCPVAFYSDKHTVFRVNKPDAKGGSGMTQFGRALAERICSMLRTNSIGALNASSTGRRKRRWRRSICAPGVRPRRPQPMGLPVRIFRPAWRCSTKETEASSTT